MLSRDVRDAHQHVTILYLDTPLQIPYTVSEHQCHTPSREERRVLDFNHLSKEFLEQMIPHLKALI